MITAAELFVRQAFRRPAEGTTAPEPVVALLGPKGAGKSTALKAIAKACGGTLVHARLDFRDARVADPISAVACVSFLLARHWDNLPRDPTFHRVGLSLLALNETLPPDSDAAREYVLQLVGSYLRQEDDERVADLAGAAVQFALSLSGIGAQVPGPAVRQAVSSGIGALLRLANRRRRSVRQALRWFSGLLEGTGAIDSLIALSQRSSDPLPHVMNAFLTDLSRSADQWTTPVRRCRCLTPHGQHGPHEHAWALLIDNVDATPAGRAFLTAFVSARQNRLPKRDPLLVVAAMDRWSADWGHWWREPWRTKADRPDKRPIPLLSQADFKQWTQHLAAGQAGSARAWYPVWLDPPGPEVLRELAPTTPDGWEPAVFAKFVERLSGSLPAAAQEIGRWVTELPADTALLARSLLFQQHNGTTLWERALKSYLPRPLLADALHVVIPQAVAVAAQLRQPGQGARLSPVAFPGANQILSALRENLWVSTFAARPSRLWPVAAPGQEHPAVLHPWLLACLMAGLHAQSASDRHAVTTTWADVFSAMAATCAGPSGDADLARRLYYHLACDNFEKAVGELVGQFAELEHPDWVRLLDQVTAAPCRWPALEPVDDIVARLVPDARPGRESAEAAISCIAALLWLYHDAHTLPDPARDQRIRQSLLRLAGNYSARVDTDALIDAAERFDSR
ncbi:MULTISPECIES: P-loop NTPase family protein [Amycolatopsis]|uniref:AAA+ ATPase domain-containing protein n=2 Tax=Amycolatopsis TaxID=1813 RepID=A0ABW5I6U0_9PSEU